MSVASKTAQIDCANWQQRGILDVLHAWDAAADRPGLSDRLVVYAGLPSAIAFQNAAAVRVWPCTGRNNLISTSTAKRPRPASTRRPASRSSAASVCGIHATP